MEDDSEEEPRQWWRFIFNDTGIDWCGTEVENNLDCPLPEFPGQDGVDGPDAQALAGTLEKEGRGAAGFDFTKIGADGSPLSVQDQLFQEGGSEAEGTSWSCVQDNHTGLLWEIKTNEGLQNKVYIYSWYSLDEETNGGDEG